MHRIALPITLMSTPPSLQITKSADPEFIAMGSCLYYVFIVEKKMSVEGEINVGCWLVCKMQHNEGMFIARLENALAKSFLVYPPWFDNKD